ncbi:MAG: Gx transporter family protein [Clostridia bacterium]|nr:Gx transporter family protein [Clostridia bacterium]
MSKQLSTRNLTVTALLAALALALSFLEGLLPPLPVPGARLGLANVTVMFALTSVSWPAAAVITAAKVLFALFRGGMACLMSAGGGVLSLLAMWVAHRLLRERLGSIGLGVVGALAHNVGQWLVAYATFGAAMVYYAPILLLLAVPAGIVTGLTLHVTSPYLSRL